MVAKLQLGQDWDFCIISSWKQTGPEAEGKEERKRWGVGGQDGDDNNRDRSGNSQKLQTPQVPLKNVRTGL